MKPPSNNYYYLLVSSHLQCECKPLTDSIALDALTSAAKLGKSGRPVAQESFELTLLNQSVFPSVTKVTST